jgi:hypothetical protein
LQKELADLEAARQEQPLLARLRADPANIMALAGKSPDPWQAALLRSASSRLMMLCSRQSGKSETAAALALREVLLNPGALVLLLSPSLRQSGELFRKVVALNNAIGRPVPAVQETALSLALANGSRVVSLPGTEGTVRGYSGVNLLVIDEGSRVEDALYNAVRPMLAVSGGKLVVLSTPAGKRGWFYRAWVSDEDWRRVRVTADMCPRISPDFLAAERLALGERWYRQEYCVSFEDAVDAVFAEADIVAMADGAKEPLWPDVG